MSTDESSRRYATIRLVADRPYAVRCDTGVRAVISGEPPEERATRSSPVEPGRVGPSQPRTSGRRPSQLGAGKRGGTAAAMSSSWQHRARARRTAGDATDDLPQGLHRQPHRACRLVDPDFPEIEERVLAYWDEDDTFRAQRRAARPGRGRRQRVRLLRRPAVRQRAAALRPPADRLRQGPRAALPDHARPARRAPLRLGHPRPARRARGDAAQRHQDHRRDRRDGHRQVQRGLPRVGASSTPASGATTSPARPAGSTSTTTTGP